MKLILTSQCVREIQCLGKAVQWSIPVFALPYTVYFHAAGWSWSHLSCSHCSGFWSFGCKDSSVQWVPPASGLLSHMLLQLQLPLVSWCLSAVTVLWGGLSLQQAAENSIVDCVPSTNEVQIWQFVFDLMLLCKLNLSCFDSSHLLLQTWIQHSKRM